MPKRVKMITSKWHRKEENFLIHTSFQVPQNAFGLSRTILFVANNVEGGGRNVRLCTRLGPQGILTGPN